MEYMIHEYPSGKFLFRMDIHTPQLHDLIHTEEHTYKIVAHSYTNRIILAIQTKEAPINVDRPASFTDDAASTEPTVTRFNCC